MLPSTSRAPPVALALALLAACAARPSATPPAAPAAAPVTSDELVAIDMFGTRQVSLAHLLAAHGAELRAFAAAAMRGDASLDSGALKGRLARLGDFASVALALIGYYEPGGMKYYLTVDFVDRADAARRMPFVPAPTGTHADPEGLLARWGAYDSQISELMASGAMSLERLDCPAFHCLGDHQHPQVKALAAGFVAQVPAHADELAAILRDDRDPLHRAAAAYLLAYASDGPALVAVLLAAFRDESSLVRNNAMRVISDIASYHPELAVPLEPVLAALDYPNTTDRNKASAILAGLLARPGAAVHYPGVAARSGATLLALLRLQQPNNHDFAYAILTRISGHSFGERDYAAWEAWHSR